MKKRLLLFSIKVIFAMVTAFVILNLICMAYCNFAIHNRSETGSTDYIWEKNKFYSRGTEGFACGVTDSNGFNNLRTFEKGDIDVLVMGSSHMEAFNVSQNKNTVAHLNNKLRDANIDMNAYNIGVSGHVLVRCLNNAVKAIDEFAPEKYLVIETSSVAPDIILMEDALAGTLKPIPSHNSGIVEKLQKFPFLRRTYNQLENLMKNSNTQESETGETQEGEGCYILFDELLGSVDRKCDERGIELVILYQSSLKIDEDGQVLPQDNIRDIENFKSVCDKYGVAFVDMYEPFKENYDRTTNLPHGFSNSRIGRGHLNETGHSLIADKLFDALCK